MRTVNLTLDEDLWREARVEAARRDLSVSALMRIALARLLHEQGDGEAEEKDLERLVDLLDACQIELTERPTRGATYAGSRFH